MIKNIHIETIRYWPGATAGLPQKTACVTLCIRDEMTTGQLSGVPNAAMLAAILPTQTASGQPINWPPVSTAPSDNARAVRSNATSNDRQVTAHAVSLAQFADWVAKLTLAIQREAGEAVWRAQILHITQDQQIELALPYERKTVLKTALWWALRWLIAGRQPAAALSVLPPFADDYAVWLEQARAGGLIPNTLSFALAAYARGWPVTLQGKIVRIGWGHAQQCVDSSFTGRTSHLASRLARNKHQTSEWLHQAGLPVPPARLVRHAEQALQAAHALGWPVVVKPAQQEQGTGVVPDIRDDATLRAAFDIAAGYAPGTVIVEKHIAGDDHRLLVVQGRLLMATRRIPGGVVGDGERSITQLVDAINADPRRGNHKRSLLMRLTLDAEALACLKHQQLQVHAIPARGQCVRLRRTANISTGGTAEDVSAQIHPDNRALAERAARMLGLDIAGVDFLCPDIRRSWRDVGGAICEVNAQPGFRPHWLSDPTRDINGEILDSLFAAQAPRIPTAALLGMPETGNGQHRSSEHAARLLHQLWQHAGKCNGLCGVDGVWLGEELIAANEPPGVAGASMLLNDPALESAVVHLSYDGLARFGHPCDAYDVVALLGADDTTVADSRHRAELAADLLGRARMAVVVNADDAHCLAFSVRNVCAPQLLVSRTADQPASVAHRARGGAAVFLAQRAGQACLVLMQGPSEVAALPLPDIGGAGKGAVSRDPQPIMFAVALAWAQQMPVQTIARGLQKIFTGDRKD